MDCEDSGMGCGYVEMSDLALRHHVIGIGVYGEGVDYGCVRVIYSNHEEVALINGDGRGKYSIS